MPCPRGSVVSAGVPMRHGCSAPRKMQCAVRSVVAHLVIARRWPAVHPRARPGLGGANQLAKWVEGEKDALPRPGI